MSLVTTSVTILSGSRVANLGHNPSQKALAGAVIGLPSLQSALKRVTTMLPLV